MILTGSIEPSMIIESFFVIMALLMFRNIITKVIIKLIRRFSDKYGFKNIVLIAESVERNISNFIVYSAIYFGLSVFPFNPSILLFINRLYRILVIVTVTQVSLKVVTVYSEVLNNNYLKNTQNEKAQATKTVFPIMSKLIKAVIIIIAVVAIAVEFNFRQLSSVMAGLGIGGAALALASQDIIKNFFGGFVILAEKSFNVGDWVKIDTFEGTVEELGLRSTKIRTIDKELVIVPNSRFADREIINYSIRENRRVSFVLGISYKTSSDKLKAVIDSIKNVLDSHPMVKEDSALVKFTNFGAGSFEISVQYLTITADYGAYMEIKNNINFKPFSFKNFLVLSASCLTLRETT